MIQKDDQTSDFSTINLLRFLWEWRKPILIITLLGAVISVIASLTIQEKFKSVVVFFPTRSNSVVDLISEKNAGKSEFLMFGQEAEAEQMMQILNSDEIRETITEQYNLLKHYDIEPDDPYRQTKLRKEFEANVTFERTKFGSINIEVLDHDPDTAMLMANDISGLLDSVKTKIVRARAIDGYNIVKAEYDKITEQLTYWEDSLTTLMNLGVHDYNVQLEFLSEQYAVALSKNNRSGAAAIKQQLDLLSKYGTSQIAVLQNLQNAQSQARVLKVKLDEAKADVNAQLSSKFTVNKAYKADRKSYPVRWLICAVSTLASFMLSIVLIVLFKNVRQLSSEVN